MSERFVHESTKSCKVPNRQNKVLNFMKKITFTLAFLLMAQTVFASEVFCRASTAWTLKINPETKTVQVYRWQELKDQFTIRSTQVKFLETVPSQIQTIYNVEGGYSFTVNMNTVARPGTRTKEGSGFGSRYGVKQVDYRYCSSN